MIRAPEKPWTDWADGAHIHVLPDLDHGYRWQLEECEGWYQLVMFNPAKGRGETWGPAMGKVGRTEEGA